MRSKKSITRFLYLKSTISTVLIALFFNHAYGQAVEGTVAQGNNNLPAAVIELPVAPDVATAAMKDHLSKKGKSRTTDIKGFVTFRNTDSIPSDSTTADLYFKVERKSRREKEFSLVSLLLTTPGSNTSSTARTRHLNIEEAKAFLDELQPAIIAFDLERQIKEQNETVIKEETRYRNLDEERSELVKRQEGMGQKILDKQNEQQSQKTEVEKQKQILTELVTKRK